MRIWYGDVTYWFEPRYHTLDAVAHDHVRYRVAKRELVLLLKDKCIMYERQNDGTIVFEEFRGLDLFILKHAAIARLTEIK